jgi:transcription elongation factor GreA
MTTITRTRGHEDSVLTREGYERLLDELDELMASGRAQIRERLLDARAQGGELSDNLELIDALEDQDFLERRITAMQAVLTEARIVDDPPCDGTIGIGTRVRVHNVDTGRTAEYDLVGAAEADLAEHRLSYESPVGLALLGRRAGDVIDVETPRGNQRLEVLAVGGAGTGARRRSVAAHAPARKHVAARPAALASPG